MKCVDTKPNTVCSTGMSSELNDFANLSPTGSQPTHYDGFSSPSSHPVSLQYDHFHGNYSREQPSFDYYSANNLYNHHCQSWSNEWNAISYSQPLSSYTDQWNSSNGSELPSFEVPFPCSNQSETSDVEYSSWGCNLPYYYWRPNTRFVHFSFVTHCNSVFFFLFFCRNGKCRNGKNLLLRLFATSGLVFLFFIFRNPFLSIYFCSWSSKSNKLVKNW